MSVSTEKQSASDPGTYRFRFYAPGDEKKILQLLRESLSWTDLDTVDWLWKHKRRPGFSREDVVVALTADDEPIACFHSAVLPLSLGNGLVSRVSLDGDFVVAPAHRGSDISTRALQLSNDRFLREGVVLRGGFTTEELNRRFYRKRYGYAFVPSASTSFKRPLTIEALRPAVSKFGERVLGGKALGTCLRTARFVVDCRIASLPASHVELRADGFFLHEGSDPDAAIRITAPYRLIAARALTFPRLLRNTAVDLLVGRLRIAGLWRSRRLLVNTAAAVMKDRLTRRT